MKFGRYEISTQVLGSFRLDGGAMFGSVPKNLWGKLISADSENCIPLVTRSLLIQGEGRKILVDVGLGEKWSASLRSIFAIQNASADSLAFSVDEITDIILTHLHFDHAGGISRVRGDATIELCYPKAQVFLQRANLENARAPNVKERASYLKENVQILDQASLMLVDGSVEIFPDLFVHRIDGHTIGQEWIEIRAGKERIAFLTDLVPTAHHLPLPYHMGYDICAATALTERKEVITRAAKDDWTVVFQHDRDTAAAKIGQDSKGRYCITKALTF